MNELQTLAGASAATTVVVAVLRKAFGLRRRQPQVVALAIGLTVSVIMSLPEAGTLSPQGWLQAILQGFVIAASAIGIHQGVTQK